MAIPRKKTNEKQTRQLPPIGCTEAEYSIVISKMEKTGLSLSGYIRHAALGQKIIIHKSKFNTDMIFQLRKLAINVNQQTRKLHETGQVPPELKNLWHKLTHLIDELIAEDL